MATAKIAFEKIIQGSQEYGSDDEHMVSRVFFTLEIEEKVFFNLYADIKQSVGGSFESSTLEVSSPKNYNGPCNFEEFRKIVEEYYRSVIGVKGTGILISGPTKLRMQNNQFHIPFKAEFEVDLTSGVW